jgi:transposase
MGTTKNKAASDWREERRKRAWALKEAGWSQRTIAEALGVTEGAVSQWVKRAREGGGAEALAARPSPGPAPKLTDAQRAEVPGLLRNGAEQFGFIGAIWTTRRAAEVIRRRFGVSYHPDHVRKLLRGLGWSVQKPVRRASQRDEGAVATWREATWPALKKGRTRRSAPSSGSTSPASGCSPA